ncbi:hypothetical protein [Secundilactobacillus folii]|uniref:Uncharacterized protein n=1 Tax=Secundilactobacillus folii TaxID=2678357 RepID=A0A7X2XVY0_9LACO|nr:hypothetical protein [Secundilactobacillus folii]MTV82669.1 hypothetical protein [Secundilactobacillus folii]
MKKWLVLVVSLFIGISTGLFLGGTKADAISSYTTPVAMRGTWYGYDKEYGFWSKIHVTKHSFKYYGSPILKGRHLCVVRGHYHGHTLVAFQYRGHAAATDSYYFGKAIVNGHKRTALIMDRSTAMFHHRVKNYRVVK